MDDPRYGICTALFSLRAGPLAREFIAQAWRHRHRPDRDVDQGAFARLVAGDGRYRAGTVYLDRRWVWTDDARIVHADYQAGSVPARVAYLRAEARRRGLTPA